MNYETWLHDILIANEAAFKTETETETKSLVILECLRNSVLSVVWEWERDIYIGDLYHRVTTPYFQTVTVPHALRIPLDLHLLPATPAAPITSAAAKPSFLARSRLSARSAFFMWIYMQMQYCLVKLSFAFAGFYGNSNLPLRSASIVQNVLLPLALRQTM